LIKRFAKIVKLDIDRWGDIWHIACVSTEAAPNQSATDAHQTPLEADLTARLAELTAEHAKLREAYRELQLELELLKRRLFIAKAERVDTKQLELEFAATLAKLDALAGITPARDADGSRGDANGTGGNGTGGNGTGTNGTGGNGKGTNGKGKSTGRRDLSKLDIPEERVELCDPELEGKAARIGFEESYKLAWRRGGLVRLVVARAKYRVEGDNDQSSVATPPMPSSVATTSSVVTTPMPPQTFVRVMAAISLVAHVISDKFCDGLPLHRQEDRFARLGVPLDRGLMSKWLEDAGATLGATVVEAMWRDAVANAFCMATDATGILVQPTPRADKKRQPCRRAHFFAVLADHDHVFFSYQKRETSQVVAEMFRGYSGYVQADAKSVFDVLFVPPAARPPPDDGADPDLAERSEVGCWAHARRKFWEAAIAKSAVAREALVRIARIFELDQEWKGLPPAEIRARRQAHSRVHVDELFAWAYAEYPKVKDQRGGLRSALGYLVRQRDALRRFLDNGRLRLDNNASERELRRVAVGRKAWLFVGSDDHGEAAGHLLTLVASARLHGLDPELYLRDVLRVLPFWPRERYLELAPKFWANTRASLDAKELAAEIGTLTVPPVTAAEENPSTN
jgi:transposase